MSPRHLGTEHVDVLAVTEHVVARPAELTLVVETVWVVDILDRGDISN